MGPLTPLSTKELHDRRDRIRQDVDDAIGDFYIFIENQAAYLTTQQKLREEIRHQRWAECLMFELGCIEAALGDKGTPEAVQYGADLKPVDNAADPNDDGIDWIS